MFDFCYFGDHCDGTMKHITRESMLNWSKKHEPAMYYLWITADDLARLNQTRELGKLFAEPNERIQCQWINENTSLTVSIRNDASKDANSSGFDLTTTDGKLRVQSKLRCGDLHLEQTRRISKKNKNVSSDSGHVVYSVGEADVYLFSRPPTVPGEYTDIQKWTFIAIPSGALEDPDRTGYLRRSVPKKIWKNYVGKAKEVLESEYKRLVVISP